MGNKELELALNILQKQPNGLVSGDDFYGDMFAKNRTNAMRFGTRAAETDLEMEILLNTILNSSGKRVLDPNRANNFARHKVERYIQAKSSPLQRKLRALAEALGGTANFGDITFSNGEL